MKPSDETTMVTRIAIALYRAPREDVGSSKKKKMRSDSLSLVIMAQELEKRREMN